MATAETAMATAKKRAMVWKRAMATGKGDGNKGDG